MSKWRIPRKLKKKRKKLLRLKWATILETYKNQNKDELDK